VSGRPRCGWPIARWVRGGVDKAPERPGRVHCGSMQGAPRRPPVGRQDSRGGNGAAGDMNWERMVFCVTSLVGHQVTAKVRGDKVYEGIFHSCSLDGDQSITLKSVRRIEADKPSGDVLPTLIIPGKDFLQVSALDLPQPPGSPVKNRRGFATDTEISAGRVDADSHGRELVAWEGGAASSKGTGLEEEGQSVGAWDQFKANEQLYGLATTFNEELYTTKLDPSSIPKAKREKAEAIARAIESGISYAEVEGAVEGKDEGDDEEARFAAAAPALSSRSGGRSSALSPSVLPQVPDRADLDGDLSVRKNTRGMMSEMKRINALNLEPTMPKLDDGARNARMNFKEQNPRGKLGSAELKADFQQSLQVIQSQEASKQRRQQQQAEGGDTLARSPSGGESMNSDNSKGFSFNPAAKAFSLNPKAGEFTPGGAGNPSGGAAPQPAASNSMSKQPASTSPPFVVKVKDEALLRRALIDILDPFFHLAKARQPDSESSGWPDARGVLYREVLGQPNPSSRPTFPMPGALGGPGGLGPGGPCRGGPCQGGPCQAGPCQGGGCGGGQCQGGGPCQGGGGPCHGGPGPMQSNASGPSGGGCGGCGGGCGGGCCVGGCGGGCCGGGCCGGGCTGCTGGCCGGGCGGCGGQQQMMPQGFIMASAPGGGMQTMQGQMYPQMYAMPSGPGGNSGPQGNQGGGGPQTGGQMMMMGQQMTGQQGWAMPKFPGAGPQQGQMMVVPMMVGPNGQMMPQPGFMPMQGGCCQGMTGPSGSGGGQMDGGQQQQGQQQGQQQMMQSGMGFNKRGGNG